MYRHLILLLLLLTSGSCKLDQNKNTSQSPTSENSEMSFDKSKWNEKEGKDYVYRNRMLNDVVYNDTIRSINKIELLDLLGEPDYIKEGHYYYRTSETRIGNWTLKTRTMVIKITEDDAIEWIKIHE